MLKFKSIITSRQRMLWTVTDTRRELVFATLRSSLRENGGYGAYCMCFSISAINPLERTYFPDPDNLDEEPWSFHFGYDAPQIPKDYLKSVRENILFEAANDPEFPHEIFYK